jgi:hypothetical protein
MFKFLDTHTYNMPGHFGGQEGCGLSVYYNDNSGINVSYEKERNPSIQVRRHRLLCCNHS